MFQKQQNKVELRHYSAAFKLAAPALKTTVQVTPSTGSQQPLRIGQVPEMRQIQSRMMDRTNSKHQKPNVPEPINISMMESSIKSNKLMRMQNNLAQQDYYKSLKFKSSQKLLNNVIMKRNQAPVRAGPAPRMGLDKWFFVDSVQEDELPKVDFWGNEGSIKVVETYVDDFFSSKQLLSTIDDENSYQNFQFQVEEIQGGTLRLQAGKMTILVDPCLTSEETRYLRAQNITRDKIAAIVISRASPEHCHIETLEKVDKSVKIIGNSTVCKICLKLGFTDVIEVNPHERCIFGDVEVLAYPGSKRETWSRAQNGYVFFYKGESMLYEPSGNLVGLKGYSERFKDRPIVSMILPMISQNLKPNKEIQVPAKIEEYLENQEYNQMIDQVFRWAPSIKNIYVRSSNQGIQAGALKNGVNVLKIQSASGIKRSQSLLNKVSQKNTQSVPFEFEDSYSTARSKTIHQMISDILEMEQPSKELMDSVEAFEKWDNVRVTREQYQQILDQESGLFKTNGENSESGVDEIRTNSTTQEDFSSPKPDAFKLNTPRIQKIIGDESAYEWLNQKQEYIIDGETAYKWHELRREIMSEGAVKSQEEKKKQKGMTEEKKDFVLKALAEIPSGYTTEQTASLKKAESNLFWQEVAQKIAKGEAQSPDEIAFYKAYEKEIVEAMRQWQ